MVRSSCDTLYTSIVQLYFQFSSGCSRKVLGRRYYPPVIIVICKPKPGPYSEAHKSNPHIFVPYLFKLRVILSSHLPLVPSFVFFPLQFSPQYNAFISRLSHACYMPYPGDIQSITINHVRFSAILLRTTDDNTDVMTNFVYLLH